jgi:hypothetical protein
MQRLRACELLACFAGYHNGHRYVCSIRRNTHVASCFLLCCICLVALDVLCSIGCASSNFHAALAAACPAPVGLRVYVLPPALLMHELWLRQDSLPYQQMVYRLRACVYLGQHAMLR